MSWIMPFAAGRCVFSFESIQRDSCPRKDLGMVQLQSRRSLVANEKTGLDWYVSPERGRRKGRLVGRIGKVPYLARAAAQARLGVLFL